MTAEEGDSTAADAARRPGERYGLPETGPGSVAGWGRRILALIVDWVMSSLVASLFVGDLSSGSASLLPLLVFAVEVWLFTVLSAGSAGQQILRIAVRRTGGRPLDPLRALVRTVLLCLVLPPVIYNRDRQGLHDLAVDSIVVNR